MKGYKLITEGAEAKIYERENTIIKDRIKKKYRIKEIDEILRKSRTNREAKVLNKLNKIVNVPKLIKKENSIIVMEKIQGYKLRDKLEEIDYKNICKQIGSDIKKIHDIGIIHGDLTTSNILLYNDKLFFIDFGLSFFSHKIEDKAVDLHLLQRALDSKHYKIADKCFDIILKSYNDKEVIDRLKKVKERGRNKAK